MSRQIKFRAWDVFKEQMDYEVFLDPNGKVAAFSPLWGFYVRGNSDDEMKLMQFTGLHDRNGQEIYEGDIFPSGARTRGEVTIICYDSRQAKFKAVPFGLYKCNAGNGGWTGFDVNPLSEVIGNIYEHPHLLKGEGAHV
ncbi:YopX family protein [Paenibacillus alvei]|uniref:YopX family protein n=1 Tax=Paenibacillus alvei TaxID=44250 RepID=A0ABT4H8Q3_PAEAL|nr:YopX family protein [Paenibacillus alvei]EJW14239.1 protein YopX [Paenibacillus alvei DSM 29]MCY9545173.1 YopX family protein [Paenibacillus alvei]MCY9704189.1 YopX family protein [Paenibacillus alvei]MCY9737994.1 YopX family protein [Paenibacillus alvei]MCY9758692.1 YopX family protein [Paenibacillus alvei]